MRHPVDVNLTLWFLIKSGYYIVTSPSTALKKTKHQGIPSESLTLWWNTQDGKIRSLKRTLNGQREEALGFVVPYSIWFCDGATFVFSQPPWVSDQGPMKIHKAWVAIDVDWPNPLDCTDLNQCGACRDAVLCRLCYIQSFEMPF